MSFSQAIILIRSTYSPYGGVERVTLGLIKGLLEKRKEVILLTLPGQKWPVADPLLQIFPRGIQRGNRLLQAWSFNRSVNQFIANGSYRCIFSLDRVAHFTHLHAGGGTHRSFLKIKAQYSRPLARFFRRFSLFHKYTLHLERKGFENPYLVKVRCNSQLVREDIQRDYGVDPQKLIVIPSSIQWREMATTFGNRQAVAQRLCAHHHIAPQWNSLLFLGSGFARKGLDLAIRGLKAMPSTYHLIVVGKGSSAKYQRLALALGLEHRVHFLGAQPNGWRYATFCRALILPSRYDPFGGAAAEGHAMGLPVLVSDKTGYIDWVQEGQNGVILKSPLTSDSINRAFIDLVHLLEKPKWSPAQLRQYAYHMDSAVILQKLLQDFIVF